MRLKTKQNLTFFISLSNELYGFKVSGSFIRFKLALEKVCTLGTKSEVFRYFHFFILFCI